MSQPVHISVPIKAVLDEIHKKLDKRMRCTCWDRPDDGPCGWCGDQNEMDWGNTTMDDQEGNPDR